MKIKAYIKMCRLLIYLSFISGYLSAQVIFKQPGDSLSQTIQTRACVYLFTGQTVSFYEVVTGCSTLTVQNVTVISGGDLYLSAPGDITINDAFDVNLGGQLNINTLPLTLPGNTMQTAINIGTFAIDFQYSDTQNTTNFTNDYAGRPSNDVFYVFTLTAPMNVTIKHCDSSIDTYLHLLDGSGTLITYNDDYSGAGACSNTYHSYLKQYLNVGTYYIVSEGYSANGLIETTVTGELPPFQFNYTYDASGNRINRTLVP